MTMFGFAAALMRRANDGADGAAIADAIVAAWQEIDRTLSPIIGQRAVAALSMRGVALTDHDYPWLSGTLEGTATLQNRETMRSALAQRSGAEAAAGGGAALQAFYELLAGLIGSGLTQRLLGAILENLEPSPTRNIRP
ncbi:MAG: hypothetical protein ABI612_07670 [Betaproteobacteria bacterium]